MTKEEATKVVQNWVDSGHQPASILAHWVAPQLALLEERIKMLEDAAKLVAETKRGRKHA